jgi:hypothetical protein
MFTPVTIDSRDFDATINFQSQGVKYLGPKSLGVLISAIETGMIIVLFTRFFARKSESLAIQILVYFVTFVAL